MLYCYLLKNVRRKAYCEIYTPMEITKNKNIRLIKIIEMLN